MFHLKILKKNINEIKSIGYPFGFKINAFEKTKITGNFTKNLKKVIQEIQMNFWVKEMI